MRALPAPIFVKKSKIECPRPFVDRFSHYTLSFQHTRYDFDIKTIKVFEALSSMRLALRSSHLSLTLHIKDKAEEVRIDLDGELVTTND